MWSASFVLFTFLVCYPIVALTNSGGTPPERTGAPGELTCGGGEGSTCHRDASGGLANLNTGPGTLTIESEPMYVAGQPLIFTVRLAQSGITRFGFQLTVKGDNNEHAGQLEIIDSAATRFAGTSDSYVTHRPNATFQTNVATWQVRWIAPSTNVGPITVYAAGNATNTDGQSKGDLIYTTSKTLMPDTGTATDTLPAIPRFRLHPAHPNPASAYTTISYTLAEAAPVLLTLYDMIGRPLQRVDLGMQTEGAQQIRLDVDGLAAGTYLYELRTPTERRVRSLVIR